MKKVVIEEEEVAEEAVEAEEDHTLPMTRKNQCIKRKGRIKKKQVLKKIKRVHIMKTSHARGDSPESQESKKKKTRILTITSISTGRDLK